MSQLYQAHRELFRREADECFTSVSQLWQHCYEQKNQSVEVWHAPQQMWMKPDGVEHLRLATSDESEFGLNAWSFGQLCRLANVSRDTVNRLSPTTASSVFAETLPTQTKPIQLLTTGDSVRSVHGAAYTRLFNVDLLSVVREFAVDFQAPPAGLNGGTGLYCGEQDMFCFLIDPIGWTEINGEAFAPGFFLWNSEVGRRSLGVSTFWFQAVCGNHIVWDPIEVTELRRKHTANVHESLNEVRRMLEALVQKRDERRDGFVQAIESAMGAKLSTELDDTVRELSKVGVRGKLAKSAIELASQHGALTIFAIVDALTRLSQEQANAGDRLEIDQQAASLLASVA